MDRKTSRLESQLCQAVKNGDPRSVQLLLSQGACPDLVGSKGVAAIHLAVGRETERNTRCLKLLLQHGADPNIKSSEGLTPLHIAAVWGCYQNLKLLLTNGGDPKAKDNDGNTPRHLAEQQENRKCAQLLQKYQDNSADKEDDLPQFQYSLYSDQTDTSGYPESDHSYLSNSSIVSDLGVAPLSSTRRSSLFNISHMNRRPGCRGILSHRVSDTETKMHHLNYSSSYWGPDCPSILSSTRVSATGPAAPLRVFEEHQFGTNVDMLKAKEASASSDGKDSPSRRDTLPAFCRRQMGRKSVSFRDVDEYFPVFSPEAPGEQIRADGNRRSFELSEYSDFLDTGRMATVLPQQGIDVTSPDHVYVFFRESSESTEEDMEKTVMSRFALEECDDEKESKPATEAAFNKAASLPVGSSSSGTGSSHYSSCDSDHYTSALDTCVHPSGCLVSGGEEGPAGAEPEGNAKISSRSEQNCSRSDVQTEVQINENKEPLTDSGDAFDSPGKKPPTNNKDKTCTTSVESGIDQAGHGAADAVQDNFDLTFTPSPFVTGRTRSRMSRCSQRINKTPESLLFTSSLFDDSLPTPVRTQRQTPRAQSREDFFSSPRAPFYTASHSDTAGDSLSTSWQGVQSSTLGPGPNVGDSQADTLILSKSSLSDCAVTQTLSDTVVLEKSEDASVNAYERNLAEVILAMQGHVLVEGEDLLTDDLTSTDEAASNQNLKDGVESLSEDAWISEECSSQSHSALVTSSSSCFSPRGSSENSDVPCTPGTGNTPRYSMSRLSSCRGPQHLANLSYTPGGRPHILDLDEPVEYLYTDTEEGHKLIETHIPPTSSTSLSSSISTSSGDETIFYDWRSMQADKKSGEKENRKPPTVPKKEECEIVLPKTAGMTDKELRLRLVELGESPGPISSRTRPTYMRRLCRLMESNSQSPRQQRQTDQSQTDLGYSPELCLALRTFELPHCHADEQALFQQFDQADQNRKWREGIIKSCFNYLLLDPRVTKNLPFRSHTMSPQECFQTFINAIFYVGKGKRSRPYSHLYEALEYHRGDKMSKKLCSKVEHILQVWNSEQGVISLHCFQNVIPVEAYTREACMVEAIGLKMLTNQKRGDFYGVVSNWPLKRKRELGIHLLYRAMHIFLAEGERQLRPVDIRQ